jgi:DNA-binding MarR family transcriptional regulator
MDREATRPRSSRPAAGLHCDESADAIDAAVLRLQVFRALRRARAILRADASPSLQPFGLSPARYELLHMLMEGRRQGWSTADIALELDLHRTSVAGTVASLQRQGLVELRADDADGRRRVVTLLPKGIQLLTAATRSFHRADVGACALLRAADSLVDLSDAMRRSIRYD